MTVSPAAALVHRVCEWASVLTAQSGVMEVEKKLFSQPTICRDCDLEGYIHVERYGGGPAKI